MGESVNITSATQVYNGLKLPQNVLVPNEVYTVKVDIVYGAFTGTSTAVYTTMFETLYEFNVEPSTGVALSTEFFVVVSSQSFKFEINDFAFGYIKGGKRHLLTRASAVPLHTVLLPQGETSDQLTLFCEVRNMQGMTYYLTKTVTVTAPTILPAAYNTIVNTTRADSVNESVRLRLQYEHLKNSLSIQYRIKAVGLMLDGLQRDGNKVTYF
jgi:hypothetical protein